MPSVHTGDFTLLHVRLVPVFFSGTLASHHMKTRSNKPQPVSRAHAHHTGSLWELSTQHIVNKKKKNKKKHVKYLYIQES